MVLAAADGVNWPDSMPSTAENEPSYEQQIGALEMLVETLHTLPPSGKVEHASPLDLQRLVKVLVASGQLVIDFSSLSKPGVYYLLVNTSRRLIYVS